MKRFWFCILACGALIAIAPAVVMVEPARAANDEAKVCAELVGMGRYATRGDCMKVYSNARPVHICNFLRDWGYFERETRVLKTFGECVKTVRDKL